MTWPSFIPVRVRAFGVRAFRYAAVGLGVTILYAIIAFAAVAMGASTIVAHCIAYVASIVSAYFAQKVLTFSMPGQHRRLGPRYAIATAILATSQFTVVWLLTRAGVSATLTLAASTFYFPPASFLLHSLWTFRTPKQRGGDAPRSSNI